MNTIPYLLAIFQLLLANVQAPAPKLGAIPNAYARFETTLATKMSY